MIMSFFYWCGVRVFFEMKTFSKKMRGGVSKSSFFCRTKGVHSGAFQATVVAFLFLAYFCSRMNFLCLTKMVE